MRHDYIREGDQMYDARSLKPQIVVSEAEVECPVKGCSGKVPRQRKFFQAVPKFQCSEHEITISPSTFEYASEQNNLLWKDEQDRALLQGIETCKRESRMAREKSEDALSWNVFRYLEKQGFLSLILSSVIGRDLGALQLVYWSYCPMVGAVWPELTRARQEFGEQLQRSSEPDLIAFSDKALLFVEAKFTASNVARPADPANLKKYLTGGNGWYHQVFASSFETIAVQDRKYELLRHWLLGSWLAAQSKRDFYLLNLVREEYEQDIEKRFGRHIRATAQRRFMRLTWEELYRQIDEKIPSSIERDSLLEYLEYKSAGYNRFGQLQRAFSLSKEATSGVNGG
jgi:hypothetical protein